jgi:hypothetical protein
MPPKRHLHLLYVPSMAFITYNGGSNITIIIPKEINKPPNVNLECSLCAMCSFINIKTRQIYSFKIK